MVEKDQPQISAAEARELAHRHLDEDEARWRVIRPITTKLKNLRTDDRLSQAMAREWGNRR